MKKTNNLIFTRALTLVLCVIMMVGTLASCFGNVDSNKDPSASNPPSVDVDTGKNPVEDPEEDPKDDPKDDPVEDLVDPDQIFAAVTEISQSALIYGMLAKNITIGEADGVGAIIPASVKIEKGITTLSLSIKNIETGSEIVLGAGESAKSLDVHVNGVAKDNKIPMIVNLGAILEAGLDATELKLYHTENGTPVLMTRVDSTSDFAIHNQYTYNAETGEVSIYVASFSVFSAVQTTADIWDGTSDTTWYNENDTEFTIENAAQFVGFRNLVDAGNTFAGKTVTLGIDIDLADIPFDPIGFGYWNESKVDAESGVDSNTVFMGTFDGAGHTVYNLYENCWELDPDKTNYSTYTYSTAGAGLFASIKNATIKNLAVSGAEIVFECVDMGIIVGYAQGTCHFENIVVTDSNIANYNRYTGGVVGEVSYGPYGIDTSLGYSHTFKNVTVDSTVKVSGLWGSFGCGMGGVIGGKWGDATVKMENVISAAEMDVYNDVVSAYQWYAFRGCGMLIGHTEEPYSDGRHSGNATASFLTCENVKVYYGDWVNYHYYEFENQDNATGRNYPWVRAEAGEYCDAFSNIRYGVPTHDGVKVSDLTEEELKAIATDYTPIVFDQLYGADRGMYGTATHEGVTVFSKNTKTIYINNNLNWTNLKLDYWFVNGTDRWSTIVDPIVLTEENGVYRIDLPAHAHGFKIVADNENETDEIILSTLTDGQDYYLGCEHDYSAWSSIDETGHKRTCSICGAVEIAEHNWNDGVITLNPTCTKDGQKLFTCAVCNDTYYEVIDATGHEWIIDDESGINKCSTCGKYDLETDYTFHFTPSTTTSVEANYEDGTNSIFAEHVTVDGVAVTKFTVAAGTLANTGVGLKTTNTTAPVFAQAGYPTVFPALKGVVIPVTLHITNTGSNSISIHYAIVNSNGEMGKVDVTVEPGETKDVSFNYDARVNDSGNNHIIALNEDVTNEASFTIWGEIDVTEAFNVTGVTVLNEDSTHNTKFTVGDTFSSEGLILKPSRAINNTKWFFVHDLVTSMDGRTFTEDDIGTHTIVVGFAGFYTTYEITVVDAEHQHIEEIDEGVDATCTESGLTEGKHCSECNEVIVAQEVIPALGHNYVDGECSRCGIKNVSVNIADYASSKEWINLDRYYTVEMDDIITLNVSEGGNNNGKFVNGKEWKIYRSEKGTITVSAAEGYTIVSITITYGISNNGTLVFNGTNIASGTELTINSDSAVFSVGNTNTATNGQVGFTNIEVVYAKVGE